MTRYELLSALFSGLSFLGSLYAMRMAGRAEKTNKKMFKRQGIIDLHMAWQGTNEIDKVNLIGPDVVKAINALSLTASLWNHDVIEKSILYQSYWIPYRDIYDTLYSTDQLIPGFKKTCRSQITPEITKAYEGMKSVDLNTVLTSNL